ncbi:MAG: sodium:calcium antiporter [Candidatus Bathyarchaeia archaeon]
MFEGLLINILILLASIIVLSKSSDLTITNSVRVADITGLGKTTIGFILVAFSTSLPELLVSIFSMVNQETTGIAIGNVLGSNVVNVCLILGVCFILATLKNSNQTNLLPLIVEEEIGNLHLGLFIASIVPLVLLYVRHINQLIGGFLLAIFVYYSYQLSKTTSVRDEGALGGERQKLGKYTLLTFLGAIGVTVTAYFIVDSASYVAENIGVPRIVIGATIIAFGTSIPELATSIDATKKGHLNLALGEIVGSCFINITCILGVALVASPFNVDMTAFSNLVMLSIMSNLLLWYFLSSEKITRREGLILLFMYFISLVMSFGGYRS